jgi:integrase/recombinase XerD
MTNNDRLLSDFLADLKIRGLTRTKSYKTYVGEFCRQMDARGVAAEDIGKADLLAFLQGLQDRKVCYYTLSKAFSCVSQFCAYLVDEELRGQNPVPAFQRRYLARYKDNGGEPRRLISIDQAAMLVNSIIPRRDKAMMLLMLKTGIRCGEMTALDVADLDLANMSLTLKPTSKRSNRLIFYDRETAKVLSDWLDVRQEWSTADIGLFPSSHGSRITYTSVWKITAAYAQTVGLHDPSSKKSSERFSPHCCRHWLVTHLLRAGMRRDFVKWIRGDAMREAIDIYYHIDPEEVRREYLARVPQLGV